MKQEYDLLTSENKQVRKLMAEIDRLREERKQVKQKCETLLEQYRKLNV